MSMENNNIHVEEPEDSLPELSFSQLDEELQQACKNAGWASLMPVQAKALPYLLAKRDIMVQSRTGSGKTGAFILPLINRIDADVTECQALILVPTRELARQVAEEARRIIGQNSNILVTEVYGGVGYRKQEIAFEKGTQLVVGTPGRILDHLLKRNFTLDALEALVFDEADRMLSIGFYPDMKQVQRYLPRDGVNVFMFSATYPVQVQRLAAEFMKKPQFLTLSAKQVHVAQTPHACHDVPRMEKDRALVRLIEVHNPSSAIIFCNTKNSVHYITAVLKNFGYDADELSADLTQNKRESIIARLRAGELKILVATDVAARGIDVPDLSHVFLYEPPEDHESYIHRAGRTGRAGATGEVISLVDTMEKVELERIASKYDIKLEQRELPTDDDVRAIVTERMTAMLEARLREKKALEQERMQRFLPMAEELAADEDGRILLAMLVDDAYQQALHAPAVQPQAKSSAPKGNKGGSRNKHGGRSGGRGSNKNQSDGQRKQQGGDKNAKQSGKQNEGGTQRRRKPRRKSGDSGEKQ